MLTGNTNNMDIPFVPALLGMNREDKLRVIHLLTESMMMPSTESNSEYTARMLNKHAGSWAGDESAADIMTSIKSHSSIREPLSM